MGLIDAKLTYEHVRQMPDDGRRYELVEGELVVSPAPKTRHQRVVTNLLLLLGDAQRSGCGKAFTAPTDVVLDPSLNAVQPDLVFVAADRLGIIAEDNIRGAPDLLVEVLSGGTAERDLGVKLRIYARYGVRFYWVADPQTETVRIYELATGGYREPSALRGQDPVGCPLFPGRTVPAADLFAD